MPLVPGRRYLHRGTAYSSLGVPDVPVSTSTPPTAGVLSLGAKTSTTVTVNWTAPTAPTTDPVTGQTIYRGTAGTPLGGSVRSYTFGNLSPSTNYSFQITATNGAGTSLKSSALNVTTDGVATTAAVYAGACPPSGADPATVTGKWGPRAAARVFHQGTDYGIPAKPAGVLVHVSYKPPDTITTAQIDAILNGNAGHVVTFHHESDNDANLGKSGVFDPTAMAARIGLQNRLYDRNVALGRPCLIAPTFVGTFISNGVSDATRDNYFATLKGDLIGIDYDGVHDLHTAAPSDNVYRSNNSNNVMTCADRISVAKRYITKWAANGWTGLCFPEVGTSVAAWDNDQSGRAQWLQFNYEQMKAEPLCMYAMYYDDAVGTTDDGIYAGTPEYTYWRAQCAANPVYTPGA